jgi:hypothetical protein
MSLGRSGEKILRSSCPCHNAFFVQKANMQGKCGGMRPASFTSIDLHCVRCLVARPSRRSASLLHLSWKLSDYSIHMIRCELMLTQNFGSGPTFPP